MGQVFTPASGGITVTPIDRETGPGAGSGTSGNRDIFLGASAGLNSANSDVIVLGNAAFDAGNTDLNGDGSVIIGSQAAQVATVFDRSASRSDAKGGAIIIGGSAAKNCNMLPNTVIIGVNALKAMVNNVTNDSVWNNTIIGTEALSQPASNGNIFRDNTFIGARAGRGVSTHILNMSENVFIGARVGETMGGNAAPAISSNVVIGYNAVPTFGSAGNPSNNVIIGGSACPAATGALNCVAIGLGTEIGGGTGATIHDNTVVGASAQCNGGSANTILGSHTGGGSINVGGSGWLLLGYGAGVGETTSNDDIICIEVLHTTRNTVLYSKGRAGNVVLGNSAPGNDRSFSTTPGTNMIKLVNGTPATANVPNGGYFYSSGGALHWVDSSGNDNTLSGAGPAFIGLGATIDPTTLAATENDYAPTGFASAQVIRVTPAAGGTTMTGLSGGTAARFVTIINNGSGDTLTLKNENAGSAAANRFATPGAVDLVIARNSAVELWYDSTGPHWHALSWS